ncbi:MAG: hypothetical protein ABIA37_04980 [Candidatus Woesearchaeota archaeon]
MQISFFEEFPTKKNLDKLKLIKFPTKLYLAAPSLQEFLKIKDKIKSGKIKEFVYWPIFSYQEGYWISPFTKRTALKRIFAELKDKKISMMLDLELPTTKNFSLYFTQLFNFSRNKRLIKRFIGDYQGKVYLAEYFPISKYKLKLFNFLGLHYDYKKARVIKMLYHSMLPFSDNLFKEELRAGKQSFGKNYLAGFGTIAKGVMKWEPILSPGKLKTDLRLAKEVGVDEVVIFRLGGLDEKYIKIIKNFIKR